MDQDKVTRFYKLNELEQVLVKCEDDISSRIADLDIKEAVSTENENVLKIFKH